MEISLLDMGKTKKRNVREGIISILSKEYPLSIKKMFNAIKKEYKLDMTYQAVFKLVKEMVDDGILIADGMEYKLNIGWIKQLEQEIGVLKKNYEPDSAETGDIIQKRSGHFVSKLGGKIKEYLGSNSSAIVGVSGGGKLLAMALWQYLCREGLNSKYIDSNLNHHNAEKLNFKKTDVENRILIVVDSSIYSGSTYHHIMDKINSEKKKFKIKEVKYAVGKDQSGLADFNATKS